MKKVAIITITDGQNYGNRLQNYALQETIKGLGFEVETCRHLSSHDSVGLKRLVVLAKKILKLFLGRPYGKVRDIRKKRFDAFNREYIVFSDIVLRDNQPQPVLNNRFDYVVVGSDQVWNAGFRIINEDLLDYLAFSIDPTKRIAYAASFGTNEIKNGFEKYFEEELPKFKSLSVREEKGKAIIDDLCGVHAEVVLDPTMLLTADQWRSFARKPIYAGNKPFIVTYFLGGRDNKLNNYIKSVASGRHIYNLDNEFASEDAIENDKVFSTTPDEFVWLMDHADCVLTDSFHATVFSIIFHRPFCVFDRKPSKESYKMGSRIDTLLEKFGLEKYRDVLNDPKIIPENYPNNLIDDILKQERIKSINFLRKALEL